MPFTIDSTFFEPTSRFSTGSVSGDILPLSEIRLYCIDDVIDERYRDAALPSDQIFDTR